MSLTVTIPAQSHIALTPFNPSLPSIPASPPMEIPASYKQQGDSYFPNPPSPPTRPAHLDSDAPVSPVDDKRSRKVIFKEVVDIMEVYSHEEYDRSPISVDPLTRDDIAFVLRYRAEMHRHTIDLYRRRHYIELQQQRETAAAAVAVPPTPYQRVQSLQFARGAQQPVVEARRVSLQQQQPQQQQQQQPCAPQRTTQWRKAAAFTSPAFQPCF